MTTATANDAPAVALEGLGKRYGGFVAVRDLSLRIARGEVFGLLGPNGAGKTTTIKMLMGVLRPTSGRAAILGLDCFERRVDVMRRVGYLPDEPAFYDHLRGGEILRFVGEMHGLSHERIAAVSGPLIERFELKDAVDEFAVNYSKGMKKKLALIAALLHGPDVLILDEPTNGLDPYATRALHELMRAEAAAGRTVVFSTHLLDQADRLCTRAGVVHKGVLAAEGPLDELRLKTAGRADASLEDVFFAATGGATIDAAAATPAAPAAAGPAAVEPPREGSA
jgi:ABC-2 type transport system ATP-binding protein